MHERMLAEQFNSKGPLHHAFYNRVSTPQFVAASCGPSSREVSLDTESPYHEERVEAISVGT